MVESARKSVATKSHESLMYFQNLKIVNSGTATLILPMLTLLKQLRHSKECTGYLTDFTFNSIFEISALFAQFF